MYKMTITRKSLADDGASTYPTVETVYEQSFEYLDIPAVVIEANREKDRPVQNVEVKAKNEKS
jgi:hypothetical protein